MAERITGHTELIGLIATPIRHSMSPTMHNEAFAHLGWTTSISLLKSVTGAKRRGAGLPGDEAARF